MSTVILLRATQRRVMLFVLASVLLATGAGVAVGGVVHQRLATRLQPTAEGRVVRAAGAAVWRLDDQASVMRMNVRANVQDGTVWDVYMAPGPLPREPIYVGQLVFTSKRAQMIVCSPDAATGYVLTVYDFNFTPMLQGTL